MRTLFKRFFSLLIAALFLITIIELLAHSPWRKNLVEYIGQPGEAMKQAQKKELNIADNSSNDQDNEE